MLLISVPEVRQQLGFDDMPDITAAIEQAGHAATAQLAAILSTDFARAEVTDIFFVDRPGFSDGPHCETQFRLSRGLVFGPPVIVGGVEPLNLGVDGYDYSTGMRVDAAKGVVTNLGYRYTNQYVSITYQAGFEEDDNDPESYDQSQVPSWLRQAAMLQTLINVADAPSVTEANVNIDVASHQSNLRAMLSAYIRYAPVALLPI